MKIRTCIVDDEIPARARVRRLLVRESDIEIVGEAASGDEAIRLVGELHPDLLFLDVQMPPPDGLAVLRAIRDEWVPCTVFTTAHSEHAVAAFELHALDYLLKPFTQERFRAALDRVRRQLAQASGDGGRIDAYLQSAAVARLPVERFLVKTNERYLVVRAADIEWVEAAANYVVLHTATGNHVLRRTLAALERELDPQRFFRTSRSALVNLAAVREVRTAAAADHVVVLGSGARVALARGLRSFHARLQAAH
jgi:two-component system, LytTR family, response regulator